MEHGSRWRQRKLNEGRKCESRSPLDSTDGTSGATETESAKGGVGGGAIPPRDRESARENEVASARERDGSGRTRRRLDAVSAIPSSLAIRGYSAEPRRRWNAKGKRHAAPPRSRLLVQEKTRHPYLYPEVPKEVSGNRCRFPANKHRCIEPIPEISSWSTR